MDDFERMVEIERKSSKGERKGGKREGGVCCWASELVVLVVWGLLCELADSI